MIDQLRNWGLTSNTMYLASMGSVLLSVVMWMLRRQEGDRAAGERFGIFVGLWAPTLMVVGHVLEEHERAG